MSVDHWMDGRAVLIVPTRAPLYRTLLGLYQRGLGGPVKIAGQTFEVESCDRHGLDPHCARVTLKSQQAADGN